MKIPQWKEFRLFNMMATLDAAPNPKGEPIILSKLLDADVMKMIEQDMEPYERLGCVFFLIEDYSSGFREFLSIQDDRLCLSKYLELKENKISHWQDKVLEALCLLQNYGILIKLGIKPQYACTLFSVNVHQVPYRIDKYAKALYSLFESLSRKQAQELLYRVYQNVDPPNCENWPEQVALELHLLWWIHKGFIQVSRDKWVLGRLLKILKELGMSGTSIYEILYNFSDKDIKDCHLDNQVNDIHKIKTTEGNGVTGNGRIMNDNEHYRIDNGLVVIFNQITFAGPIEWERRYGSEKDCHEIEKTFRDTFGFKIEHHTDLDKSQIYSELDGLASRAKDYDCVVVVILSHGTYGNIIASDGEECAINEIKSKVCSNALKDKPKVLVIQACQKHVLTTDGPRIGQNSLERFEDLLEMCSTIPGEVSVRDPQNGTWFITILCKVLVENEGRSVYDCFTKVNSEFKEKETEIKGSWVKQLPQVTGTLAKILIFPHINKAGNK